MAIVLRANKGSALTHAELDANFTTMGAVHAAASVSFKAANGAVGTPSYSFTGDTNTGMYWITTDTLGFSTAGAERMRITSTGNIGIGLTSPDSRLEAYMNTDNLKAITASSAASWISMIPKLAVGAYNTLSQAGDVGIIFSTDNNGSVNDSNGLVIAPWGPTLGGIRIQEDGNVGIGVSSPVDKLEVGGGLRTSGTITARGTSPTITLRDTDNRSSHIHCNSNYWYVLRGSGNDSAGWTDYSGYWPINIYLENNDAQMGGTLNVAQAVNAYSSDQRLKENIKEIPDAIEKIKKIRGVTFDWNDLSEQLGFRPDSKYNEIGVIAQEIQAVIPQAITLAPFDRWTGQPDSKYPSGYVASKHGTSKSGENYLTVKMERIIPLLIEGIKEQQKLIEAMQEEIDQLKSV